jgi:hypothetical protein
MGMGIGFVDAHLLASAQLSGIPLWTSDNRKNFFVDNIEHYHHNLLSFSDYQISSHVW